MAKRIMKEFRLDEISIVDHPAQRPAKIVLSKRDDIAKRLALTEPSDGHAHLIRTGDERDGTTSYADEHSHGWMLDDGGNIVLAEAKGHTHGIAILTKSLTEEQLACLAEVRKSEASTTAGTAGDSGGRNMTDQDKQPAEELATLKAELAKAKKLAELGDAEKEFMKALDAPEKFLELSADERKAQMAKAQDADPVVYKTEDGLEIRKSAGDVVLALAKKADEERKARQELEKQAAEADLAKRAQELQISGDDAAKRALLKAVDSLGEAEQKAALELLNTNTERLAKAQESLGSSDAGASDAETELENIAKRIREADPKLTKEQALVAAMDTAEGASALLKMRSK